MRQPDWISDDGRHRMYCGDCLDILPLLGLGVADAVVTDPPYGLEFMGAEWDKLGSSSARWEGGGSFSKPGIGERRTEWPSYSSVSAPNRTCECGGRERGKNNKRCHCGTPRWKPIGNRRGPGRDSSVPKPGNLGGFANGNKPSFARVVSHLPRMQAWHFQWAERALAAIKRGGYMAAAGGTRTYHRLACALEDAGFEIRDCIMWIYGTGFPKAKSCLKPAYEPFVLTRNPVGKMLPLGIDECRIGYEVGGNLASNPSLRKSVKGGNGGRIIATEKESRHMLPHSGGRWPANVVLDEAAAVMLDEATADTVHGAGHARDGGDDTSPREYKASAFMIPTPTSAMHRFGDSGGASRFFYCAKASRRERGEGNNHPTVKPIKLMEHLVQLLCPEDGVVGDWFTGSGTTGVACVNTGRRFIGIEKNPKYFDIAVKRVESAIREQSEQLTFA